MSISMDVRINVGEFRLDVGWATGAGTTAVLGASGAGKTLTLRAIAGLHKPESGRVAIDGATLFDSEGRINVAARDRHVGYVFQDYALFPHLTVAENIAFGMRGASRSERADGVGRMLDMLRLAQLADRYPAGLSGGERQRVALGRALAPQPRLLLLDEPFSALDAPTRELLTEELLALRERIDVPAVLVTHDVSEAYALSDELVLLGDQRVLQSGAKAAVFDAPSSPAAARLVGVQNVIDGIAVGGTTIEAGGLTVESPTTLEVGEPVLVGVRASGLSATPAEDDANATLVQAIDRGARLVARLALDGGATVVAELARGGDVGARRWRVDVRPRQAMVW